MKKSGPKNIDFFVLFNLMIFALICYAVYYDRFIRYRGAGHILEFFIYGILIVLTIIVLWLYFRKYSFKTWTLVLAEIGIIMHFAGAFVSIDHYRLYDVIIFGLRYDKYVHFTNSLAVAFLIKQLIRSLGLRLNRLENLIIILIVLGLGAIVEIVEYVITKTVPENLVGDYDNNMQDLMSNLAAGLCFLLINATRRDRGGPSQEWLSR